MKTGKGAPQYRAVSEDGKKETNYYLFWKNGELVWHLDWEKEYDDHHNEIVHTRYGSNEFTSDTTTTYEYVYNADGEVMEKETNRYDYFLL